MSNLSSFWGSQGDSWSSLFGGGSGGKKVPTGTQYDAAGLELGYAQGKLLGTYGNKGEYDFLHTGAPGRINEYRIGAERAIDEMGRSSLLAQSESILGRFGIMARQNADAAAQQGINPAAYFASVNPQQQQQMQQQSAAVAGGVQGQQAMMGMDLGAQILNSMNQLEAYYDSLKLQNYLASRARKTARSGASSAMTSSLMGAAGAAVGGYFGGPAGATAGATAGSQVGGG